ncbi:uncharacterized protein [Haliotis asinina]|uniref:uncharacterized protein n=1 Tax=Haliotis asinina TaxID=109174 RepID=UPI003531FEF4
MDSESSDSDREFEFRFGEPLDNNAIDKELEICVPKSTKYKNDWVVVVFTRWQEERCQRAMKYNLDLPKVCLSERLFEVGAENLNLALKFFLFEARKQDGGLYPSHTLYGIYASLQSAIRAKGCKVNMFEDKEFEDSRRCLDAVMRERSAEGLGAGSQQKRYPSQRKSSFGSVERWETTPPENF